MPPAPEELPQPAASAALDARRVLRETTWLAIAAMLIAIVGALGLWVTASRMIRDNYGHYLTSIARSAAQRIDPALHASLRDPAQMNGADYRRAVEPLRQLQIVLPEVASIYTMVRDGDVVRFVLDAAPPGDNDGDGIDDQGGLWEIYTEREPAMEAALGDGRAPGRAAATDHPYADKWGSFMTGWAPLIDARGRQFGALGVDVDAKVYFAMLERARHWALLGLLPAALLILLLTAGFHRLRTRQLAALTESESNLRSLFELSPLGICLCELPGGRFLKVNDAMLGSTGYTRDELQQLTFWDLMPAPQRAHELELHAGLGPGSSFGPSEMEYQRKDGSRYPVLVSGLRVCDSSGRELGWGIVQDISKRKAMESELAAAANRDRLTGLANRTLFLQWLQDAIDRVRAGRQRGFATLFLDFDRFKLVNDAMGHEAGDALLREITARLRDAFGASAEPLDGSGRNLVARFGGDEFLVLLNDADGATARRIADQLLASLSRPFLLMDREVFSTASIGIVTGDQCLESAEAVVRNADVAMYEAKRSGRACAVMFDDAMRARLTRYVTIDSQLRAALETDQFSLVYQPIVELHTGRVTSVEALARWHHPTLGAISPAEFIPVAEESGLIVTLGQRVLEEACAALASWRAQDGDRAPQTICVNVSRAELALGKRLLERVSDTLFRCGLPPQCLRLEVTERDAMRDPGATLQLMRDLRGMGVRLAMDDFGTGTSSLGCLRDYPFDVIKIDRSFVSDVTTSPEVLALIHAAVTLVQNLGKTSVAEGVETAEQRAILQSLGCQYGQGYYFSRPLTDAQMSAFMALPAVARA